MEISPSQNKIETLLQEGKYADAEQACLNILENHPKDKQALFQLAVAYDQQQNLEQAEKYYRLFLNEESSNMTALKNLASLLFDQGKAKEARSVYEQTLELNPNDIDAHFAYSKTGAYDRNNLTLQALDSACSQIANLPDNQKIKLCFTIGKANQDIGEYAAAFDAFSSGANLQYQMAPFDEASHFNMLDDIRQCFSADYFQQAGISGIEDPAPIFILGMPRSGSTLIEQILASHSMVTGAGELKYLKQSIQTILIGDSATFSNAMGHWDKDLLAKTANDYLEKLHRHVEKGQTNTQRIVDKMPGNFAFIGLITQLFPKAKIIHSVRHPMATLWSNFSTLFGDALNYSYRLDVLARYFKKYQELMAHWQAVLPEQSFYNLEYEQLVHNPDSEVKALLNYLQLPWEDRCLEFHTNSRSVKTASIMQVNQPLYSSSLDLWKNYQTQLKPLEDFLSH